MVRMIMLLVVGLWIGVVPSVEQGEGNSQADLVSSAEREAATFPVESGLPRRMKKVFASPDTPGTTARKCVTGSGRGPLRSGEFVIGGELSGQDPEDPRRRVAPKLWWSPLHHGEKMELLVRARRVGSGGEYRFHGVTVAHSSSGPNQLVPEAEREYFFPSAVEFLHSGTWVVVATQGSDWGCFILTMPSPVAG